MPFVPYPPVQSQPSSAGSANEVLEGVIRASFGRLLSEEGEEGETLPPPPEEPEFVGPDIGQELLTMGGLVVIGLLMCGIVCVLRATGSMPRPLRKLCCAVEG